MQLKYMTNVYAVTMASVRSLYTHVHVKRLLPKINVSLCQWTESQLFILIKNSISGYVIVIVVLSIAIVAFAALIVLPLKNKTSSFAIEAFLDLW